MKRTFYLTILIVFLISCKKEDTPFISEYRAIPGTWDIQSLSLDSSGIKITKSLPYNRLEISNNLDYKIFMNSTNLIESGTITIVYQTQKKLEVYFGPEYPAYSSFAGSHLFGFTDVELVLLTENKMIFKTIDAGYEQYSDREINFIRQ
jgi:hypothetical protein